MNPSTRPVSAALIVTLFGTSAGSFAGPLPAPQVAPPAETAPPPEPKSEPKTQFPLSEPLSLAGAIRLGLQLQPTLAAVRAQQDAAEARRQQSQSRYYPDITPQYSYVTETINGQNSSDRTVTQKQAGIGLRYTVYDSGLRELSTRQARQSLRAQVYETGRTRQNVIADVASFYFNALLTDAIVRVSEAQVVRASEVRRLIQAQIEAGVTATKDIYQAEADLANAQVNLLQTRNSADIAQAQLKRTIGIVASEPLKLVGLPAPTEETPTIVPLPNAGQNPDETLTELTRIAYDSRPDIAQARQGVEASQTSVAIARVNNGVQVNSQVTAGYQFDPNDFIGSPGNNRQFQVGVSYPLFDGGLTRAQVSASRANERASEAQLENTRQQVAVDVEQSFRTLQQTRATIPAAVTARRAAEINYQFQAEALLEGAATVIDVVTAQTQLVQAQINYIQAVYNFYSADTALARAVGRAPQILEHAESLPAGAPLEIPEIPPLGTVPAQLPRNPALPGDGANGGN